MNTKDVDWSIEKGKTSGADLLFHGNIIKNYNNFKSFNFLEKDFNSTIPEYEPAQFLHRRFKILHSILKNNLRKTNVVLAKRLVSVLCLDVLSFL